MIYLDNAATTFPKPEVVYEAMDKMNREGAVNAGRGSYKLAREASKLIQDTKKLIRNLVYADASAAVVFTPSITIAMNQIINGLPIRNNAVVYVSPYEHNAVARPLNELSKRRKIYVKELPIDENLEIDIEKMKYEFIKDKPEFLFCTHISNVTGYILPIEEIFNESKKHNCINILDSAQSLGLIDSRFGKMAIDIMAFTGHKTLYGPFGIGGFINLSDVPMGTFIAGGTGSDSLNLDMPQDKEGRYEAASSNVIAVAGLKAALNNINVEQCETCERKLTNYLIQKIKDIHGVKMFLPKNSENHIGIVSFCIGDMDSNDIGTILDEDFDIAVRTGYHCAPYIHKYMNDKKNRGTVRVGLSQFNKTKDINWLIEAINDLTI